VNDDFKKDGDSKKDDDSKKKGDSKKVGDSNSGGYFKDGFFVLDEIVAKKSRLFQTYEFNLEDDDLTGYARDDSFAVAPKSRPLARIRAIDSEIAEEIMTEHWRRIMERFQKYESESESESGAFEDNYEIVSLDPEIDETPWENKNPDEDDDDGGDGGENLG
jgi:hypothetical protein